MMDIQFFTQLPFAFSAQATAMIITTTSKATLAFPCLSIISLVSAFPSEAFFTRPLSRSISRRAFWATRHIGFTFHNLKGFTANHAVPYFPVIRPSRLQITLRRAIFRIGAILMCIKFFIAHRASLYSTRAARWSRIVIVFIPRCSPLRRARSTTKPPFRVVCDKRLSTILAGFIHEVFPYRPYVHGCGQAVRLAVRTVHDAALAHINIIPRERLALPYTPPMFTETPAPAPTAEQAPLFAAAD